MNNNYLHENYPVTNRLVEEVISLPMHTELELEQQEYISEVIINFLK